MHWPTDVLAGVVFGVIAGIVAMPLAGRFFPTVNDCLHPPEAAVKG
jgi:membrane-associated phospholipid phosphatase